MLSIFDSSQCHYSLADTEHHLARLYNIGYNCTIVCEEENAQHSSATTPYANSTTAGLGQTSNSKMAIHSEIVTTCSKRLWYMYVIPVRVHQVFLTIGDTTTVVPARSSEYYSSIVRSMHRRCISISLYIQTPNALHFTCCMHTHCTPGIFVLGVPSYSTRSIVAHIAQLRLRKMYVGPVSIWPKTS